MKGYIYCKECGKIIAELDEVEYCQKKEEGTLPDFCEKCFAIFIAENIDLNLDFLGELNL